MLKVWNLSSASMKSNSLRMGGLFQYGISRSAPRPWKRRSRFSGSPPPVMCAYAFGVIPAAFMSAVTS